MGVHVANGAIRTSNKGLLRTVFNFSVDAGGDPVVITQAGANFVSSVTHTGAGIYTVQLNQLYPVRLIYTNTNIATPASADAMRIARIDSDSYSATAGTFIVLTSTNDGTATDPLDGSLVNVELCYVDQTTGIAS